MRKRTCHCKHKHLNPTPRPLCEKPGRAMPICTPGIMSVVRQEDQWGLLAASLAPGSVRGLLKEVKWGVAQQST